MDRRRHYRTRRSIEDQQDRLIARVIDAPRHLVFRAMTEAALIRRWFGVQRGWTFEVCEHDARVGGAYHYVWVRENRRMGMRGVLRELVPNTHRLDGSLRRSVVSGRRRHDNQAGREGRKDDRRDGDAL